MPIATTDKVNADARNHQFGAPSLGATIKSLSFTRTGANVADEDILVTEGASVGDSRGAAGDNIKKCATAEMYASRLSTHRSSTAANKLPFAVLVLYPSSCIATNNKARCSGNARCC